MRSLQNIQTHEGNIKSYFKWHPTTNVLSKYSSFTQHQHVAKRNLTYLT